MTPAEVNIADVTGATALHVAARSGDARICGVLLGAGARLDAKTLSGMTPLAEARHFHPTNTALHALLSGAGPSNLPGTVCDHCGKTAEQADVKRFKSCSACFGAHYCDAACQTAGWAGHKAACKERRAKREQQTKLNVYEPLC
jgi:MYND finger/Ankyrin repeat